VDPDLRGGSGCGAQISIATQGGSGTPVPDISVEVDDFDAVLARVSRPGLPLEYGPQREPWGVTRFYVRDPFGRAGQHPGSPVSPRRAGDGVNLGLPRPQLVKSMAAMVSIFFSLRAQRGRT
jgi:catechol 2,3-dioxygenase-like lactoylglutathione lyase family enzyme